MPSVCVYLQVHQPFRLRKYSIFDSAPDYFDDGHNSEVIRRVAEKCYLPTMQALLEMIYQQRGAFRCGLSITGTALEQFESHAPAVVHALYALAKTGAVEFLGETYYHSLSALYSRQDFAEQVNLHRAMLHRLFAATPTVFRNTELIYSNDIALQARALGFHAALVEGWEPMLNNRSPAFVYEAMAAPSQRETGQASTTEEPAIPGVKLLLRNHSLSDQIAFRFSDPRSPDFPVTAAKLADHVAKIGGHLCNVFMDMETFGEHQAAETGIIDLLKQLPSVLLAGNCDFLTPSEAAAKYPVAGVLDVPQAISWADEARDLSAWTGNAMQSNALQELYRMERAIRKTHDARLLADWRKLTTSDHTYYMSTKNWADGSVHEYFSPYESPYDAYINFMNVLENLRARAG
jgi:alpha-amylase